MAYEDKATEANKSDYINVTLNGVDKDGKPFTMRLNGMPTIIKSGSNNKVTAKFADLVEAGIDIPVEGLSTITSIHFSTYRADSEPKELPF